MDGWFHAKCATILLSPPFSHTDNGTWWLSNTSFISTNYAANSFLGLTSWTLPTLTFSSRYSLSFSGNFYICSTNDFDRDSNVISGTVMQNQILPPITVGLVGLYTASSWKNGLGWIDLSGNGNHAEFGGTIGTNLSGINGLPYLYGDTNSWLMWPAAILPPTYTLFHIAKHNNGARGRIFRGFKNNWFSGFHVYQVAGVAYHDGWLTPIVDTFGYNWGLSTDQNTLYRCVHFMLERSSN